MGKDKVKNDVEEIIEDVAEMLEDFVEDMQGDNQNVLTIDKIYLCKNKNEARKFLREFCEVNQLNPSKYALPVEVNQFLSSLR